MPGVPVLGYSDNTIITPPSTIESILTPALTSEKISSSTLSFIERCAAIHQVQHGSAFLNASIFAEKIFRKFSGILQIGKIGWHGGSVIVVQ